MEMITYWKCPLTGKEYEEGSKELIGMGNPPGTPNAAPGMGRPAMTPVMRKVSNKPKSNKNEDG